MEEEVLSDENTYNDVSNNRKPLESSKVEESYKETITVTDTDMDLDRSVPAKQGGNIPVIALNTEIRQSNPRMDHLTDRSQT